jgi:hypothetical protein
MIYICIINQLIKKEKLGEVKITGQKTFDSAADYYKCLLLISSKSAFSPPKSQSEQSVLRDYFLRAYPYYYLPDIVETIFELRFQRYWYIYNDLIGKTNNGKVAKVKEGMDLITKGFNLSLKDYFHVLTGIFTWFLIAPNAKRKNPKNNDLKKIGFDFNKAIFCSTDKLYSIKYGITKDIINNQTPEIVFNNKNPFLK